MQLKKNTESFCLKICSNMIRACKGKNCKMLELVELRFHEVRVHTI